MVGTLSSERQLAGREQARGGLCALLGPREQSALTFFGRLFLSARSALSRAFFSFFSSKACALSACAFFFFACDDMTPDSAPDKIIDQRASARRVVL